MDIGAVFKPCVVPYWSVGFPIVDSNLKSAGTNGAETLFVGTHDPEALALAWRGPLLL